MTHDLNQMLIFAKVVEHGSFIGAARALGIPKSTVSRKLQELEERLGTRLLQRTTRRLALTEAGAIYHGYCSRVEDEMREADEAVGQIRATPRGLLRVSASFSFGMSVLVPIVPAFMARYPDIHLQLELRNDTVDLLAEGFDLSIMMGPLPDSSYAQRYLGETALNLYASPAYLAHHPAPAQPADLAAHPALTLSRHAHNGRFVWRLNRGKERHEYLLNPRLVSNDPAVLKFSTLAGQGIGLLPAILVRQELEAGQLQRVLPDWRGPVTPFIAVFPSQRGLSLKVRVFVDYLVQHLDTLPGLRLPPAN